MENALLGLHHVTAIAGDPQQNLDFYTQLLGLRLVKLTVNYDDPGAYHFYYGDALGRPGTILTFFSWPGAPRGREGTGQIAATSFTVPAGALDYWADRLGRRGIAAERTPARFGEQAIAFRDPDGLALQLVAQAGAEERPGWPEGPVPAEQAIRGLHAVTAWEGDREPTARLLTETLGFRPIAEEDGIARYAAGAGGAGKQVDVWPRPDVRRGVVAVGTVHHIAWRAATDDAQLAWRETLEERGLNVTPVLDRQYFHSIYFREPGGVLFEIATDPPGFTVDEAPEQLGTRLRLPAWLEPHRAELEQALPPVRLPAATAGR
jgi:glyoxalase family protein